MSLFDRRREDRGRFRQRWSRPWLRFVALTLYYLAIMAGLAALYGQGDFSTPPFVYQNF